MQKFSYNLYPIFVCAINTTVSANGALHISVSMNLISAYNQLQFTTVFAFVYTDLGLTDFFANLALKVED